MKAKSLNAALALLAGTATLLFTAGTARAMDDDEMKALLKKNDCFKCHAIDKTKKGPSYKKIAAKYKGKADGEEKAVKNMTTGSKVKLEDGSEEEHKIIEVKDPKVLKEIAQWILSR